MTRIKFCGLQHERDLALAEELHINYAGFVVVPTSRRYVTLQQIIDFQKWIQTHHAKIQPVLVMMNLTFDEIVDVVSKTGIRHIQLAANENPELCQKLKAQQALTIWKSWHLPARTNNILPIDAQSPSLLQYLDDVDGVLLDTSHKGNMGGTGTIFDWQQIAELKNVIHEFPMIVAGGLTPDNVTELISKYRPFAVDVSSGIEDNGQKDPRKMRKFAAKVREGDDESESSGTIW